MDSFVPEENKQIAMAMVGSVNIFAGILSTLQNFLRYAELMESHRLSEVQWSKFGRNIAVELALDPKRRKSAYDFLKISRAEYDRLIEQSPTIDDDVIKRFQNTFKKSNITRPDMCNGLGKCKIFETSKEEKLETMMTHVGSKLIAKKRVKHWTIDDIPIAPIADESSTRSTARSTATEDSKKELDELRNISRVSSFRNHVNTIHEESELTGQSEIHRLVASVQMNDTENPDTENPDTEPEKTEDPDTEPEKTEDPDTEPEKTEDPDTENPDTENPDTENPDTDTEDLDPDRID